MNIFLDREKFWREVYGFFKYIWTLMTWTTAIAYIWLGAFRKTHG